MASTRICLQWTVIIFNTLSVILGILAIVACIYDFERFTESPEDRRDKIVQLVAACLLVISAFVGCCGAVNGSIKVLLAFIVILFGLICTHGWTQWHYNEANQIKTTDSMVNAMWIEELVKAGSMSSLQETYECCGKKSYTDYTSLQLPVPQSCYLVKNGMTSVYPFAEGCSTAVKRSYMAVYRYGKLAHWSLIGFELVGILLSFVLIFKLVAKTRSYRY